MAQQNYREIFETLTEKQREALELACGHYTSKQIARKLKIAPATADKRIDAIRAKLNFLPRAELLRAYSDWKNTGERTTGDPIPLTVPPENAARVSPQSLGHQLRFEDALVFDARPSWDRESDRLWSEIKPSDFGIVSKLIFMLGGAIAILMVAVLSIAVSNALETALGVI